MLQNATVGTVTLVETLSGPAVDVLIVEDRFGNYYLQYEYSRPKNQWRFVPARDYDDMSHPACYSSKSGARRAAKRVFDRNN